VKQKEKVERERVREREREGLFPKGMVKQRREREREFIRNHDFPSKRAQESERE